MTKGIPCPTAFPNVAFEETSEFLATEGSYFFLTNTASTGQRTLEQVE